MDEDREARTLVAEASFALRMLSQFHTDKPRGTDIIDVWTVVGKVMDSAWIEHQRLAGTDVSAAEQHLRDIGWLPWRDLYDDSSDGETDERAPVEATDEPGEAPRSLWFDRVTDSRGRQCIAVPLDPDPSYFDGRR